MAMGGSITYIERASRARAEIPTASASPMTNLAKEWKYPMESCNAVKSDLESKFNKANGPQGQKEGLEREEEVCFHKVFLQVPREVFHDNWEGQDPQQDPEGEEEDEQGQRLPNQEDQEKGSLVL